MSRTITEILMELATEVRFNLTQEDTHLSLVEQATKEIEQIIAERVIGKDDKPTPIQKKMIGGLTLTDANRNRLRAEQREKLKEVL